MRLSAPIRFLMGVFVLWTAGRFVAIQLSTDPAEPATALAAARPAAQTSPFALIQRGSVSRHQQTLVRRAPRFFALLVNRSSRGNRIAPLAPSRILTTPWRADALRGASNAAARADAEPPPPPPVTLAPGWASTGPPDFRLRDRFTVSVWAFVRPGGGRASLAEAGQLGGSQAGARATYRLTNGREGSLAFAARVSRPLSTSGAEAALGLAWRPDHELPLELAVERRIALERGGRDAWAAGIAGGVDGVSLPIGLDLDGYGQAGVVGARARDLYVDGGIGVGRRVALSERASIRIGAGAWGAAQPDLARLDVGPQVVARFPAGPAAMRVSLEWRQRIAGDAAPRSGLALTLATDF